MSALARAAGAVVSLSALALILSAVPGGTAGIRAYRLAWIAMAVVSVVMLAASSTVPGRGEVGMAPARRRNGSDTLSRY
jgi:hypothetical protein